MDIEIRKATLDDLYTIQTLNNILFNLEYENFDDSLKVGWPFEKDGEEYFKNMITEEIVFVAEVSNIIVGYLAGSLNVHSSYVTKSLAEVDNMCILKEYRKYGIGSKLMDKFIETCKENKIEEVKVTASAKNINAINFYKKNGFDDFEVTFKKEL